MTALAELDRIAALAERATQHNRPHVGDCKGCVAKFALTDALTPERVITMAQALLAAQDMRAINFFADSPAKIVAAQGRFDRALAALAGDAGG